MIYTYDGMLFILKRKKILSFGTASVDMAEIMLREMSDKDRQILYGLAYTWGLKKSDSKTQKVE